MAWRAFISVGAAVADDHDAPAHRDHPQVLLEVHVGEHLQDDVDARGPGQAHHLVEIARGGVVQHVVRALLGHEPAAALGARGADHGQPARPRELHRADADAAARAVDEHGLARPPRARG